MTSLTLTVLDLAVGRKITWSLAFPLLMQRDLTGGNLS
jgi:hypothetical protein